jgi:hypothetical protein
MADDVLANAGHQQPAPNITNNDITMSYVREQSNEDNKMEEEVTDNENLVKLQSYATTSTNIAVATNTATTITNNSINNTNQTPQLECPNTPFTSNTSTSKNTSSPVGYLPKTPTTPPTKDLSVYDYQKQLNDNSIASSPKRSFNRKNTSQPTNMPVSPVPPITPFTLGQTIQMYSLQKNTTDDLRSTSTININRNDR